MIGEGYEYYTDYDDNYYIKDELSRGRVVLHIIGLLASDQTWSFVTRKMTWEAAIVIIIRQVSPIIQTVTYSPLDAFFNL